VSGRPQAASGGDRAVETYDIPIKLHFVDSIEYPLEFRRGFHPHLY